MSKTKEELTQDQQDRLDMYHAFKKVFGGVDGDLVMKELEDMCYYNEVTFDPMNEQMTFFREGARSVVLKIKEIVAMSEDDVVNEFHPQIVGEDEE